MKDDTLIAREDGGKTSISRYAKEDLPLLEL
jgi:hypothetical protein